jgi:RES domain-containing protein
MIVFRLSKQAFIRDLSGMGAEKTGGRWNSKDVAVLYTAASRALAVVEVVVHVPVGIIPVNYQLATIEVPDNSILKIDIKDLPKNWATNPFTRHTQDIGNKFIRNNEFLVLQVPSATVTGDTNYLINPKHLEFNKVKIKSVEPFMFDVRLFKK